MNFIKPLTVKCCLKRWNVSNTIKVQAIYSMQSVNGIASRMNEFNFYTGDPDHMSSILETIESVSPDEMLSVIRKYSTENYARLLIAPGGEK